MTTTPKPAPLLLDFVDAITFVCGPDRGLTSGRVRLNPSEPPSIDLDQHEGANPENAYWVALERIKTPADAANWIAQLHEKNWVTDAMMRDFIEILNRLGKLR